MRPWGEPNLTVVHIRQGDKDARNTKNVCAQKEGHRGHREEEASGETSPAVILIMDLQPPRQKKYISVKVPVCGWFVMAAPPDEVKLLPIPKDYTRVRLSGMRIMGAILETSRHRCCLPTQFCQSYTPRSPTPQKAGSCLFCSHPQRQPFF